MIFHYRYKDENNVVRKGRLTVDSEEAASARLERMSIKPMAIWEDGQPEPPWEAQKPEIVGIEPTPPDSFFKDQEELFKTQEKKSSQLPPNSFKPVMSDGIDPTMPTFGDPPPSPAVKAPSSRDLASIVPNKEQILAACPKRVQSFFFGEYENLKLVIDQHLSEGGKVIHLAMQPDVKGKLQMSVVIEHDKGRRQ